MSTKTIRIPVEQVLRDGLEVPDNLAIGRCNSQTHDVGIAWPVGAARLGEMACPLCGGPLTMTTRQLQRPFHVVGRDATQAQARRSRAAAKAALQANVAAGRSKLARGLAPGDVLHREASRRGCPVRIVDAGLPGERKSHVGLRVQVPLETLRQRGRDSRLDESGCYLLSLPASKEVHLAGESARGYTWPASAAEVRVAVARRDLEHAEQMLAHANERLAADSDDPYRANSVTAWTDRVTQCVADLDAGLALLDRERPPPIREGQE